MHRKGIGQQHQRGTGLPTGLAALNPVAQEMGLPGVSALVAQLRERPNPALESRITEAMTINEISFFRDIYPFESLKNYWLPTLIEKRKASKSINIWCAASSSGQEPYSIAMTIREHFPELNNWIVRITATDLSNEMVSHSRRSVQPLRSESWIAR
ncbi:MAG: CheR family methyltransferase [Pirellulaceae bacterium]